MPETEVFTYILDLSHYKVLSEYLPQQFVLHTSQNPFEYNRQR